jgi:hypothetical protein
MNKLLINIMFFSGLTICLFEILTNPSFLIMMSGFSLMFISRYKELFCKEVENGNTTRN